MLAWSAHQSLLRKWCRHGTLLSISSRTITLYGREFSLNIHDIRRMTVIGTYSTKFLYCVCWCCLKHWCLINQHSIGSIRNVLIWSHAPSSKLTSKMDFCSSHVIFGKVCMYFHTWEANWQCFHETEIKCTSLISAISASGDWRKGGSYWTYQRIH